MVRMPRYRRRVDEGTVQHLISRFVNHVFLFDLPHARDEYLERAAHTFARTDWVPLGYASMSSHVHWLARAGSCSSDRLVRSLHAGFAGWLNRSAGRRGPVFADRHRNVQCGGRTALAMLAYIHNNPVRAGVVRDPRASTWTSHRTYIGLDSAGAWLNIDLGLELSGLDPTDAGREAFHDFVASRMNERRRPDLSAANLQQAQREARKRHRLPVEVVSPSIVRTASGLSQHIDCIVPARSPLRPTWQGSPLEVVSAIAHLTDIPERIVRSCAREHAVCAARRLALLVWVRELARPVTEMAHVLGITSAAASNHLVRSTRQERALARRCMRALTGLPQETAA